MPSSPRTSPHRPRLLSALSALLALVFVAGLTGCSGGSKGTGDAGYVSGDSSIAEFAPENRKAPAEQTGDSVDGEPLDLSDYRGKPVVVPVWGAWCVECRKEGREVAALAKEYATKAPFVGVNIRDNSRKTAQAFQKEYGQDFPSFYSPDGQALLAFDPQPISAPAFLVLDREGRVAALINGAMPSPGTLSALIDKVLEEEPTSDG